jgi:hypothetical protein
MDQVELGCVGFWSIYCLFYGSLVNLDGSDLDLFDLLKIQIKSGLDMSSELIEIFVEVIIDRIGPRQIASNPLVIC